MNGYQRRDFLKYSAMASMAFSLPLPRMKSTGPPIIKKALMFGMIKENLSIMDKFKLVKDLGFDGIELDSPNDLNEKEVLEARDKTGIELPGVVNSIHWKSPLSDPDPAVRATCVESMITALNDCKKYGGTSVLLVPAVVNDKVSYAEAYERSQAEIKKLLPVAEKTGVKIAIENVWNNFLLSPLEAARYIDDFNHPMIGWHFDIGNVVRYGWPEQWINTLGKRILKLHIKDYSRKMANDLGVWKGFDAELGEGDANYAAVNKALKEVGYKGWGSAEVNGGDRVRLKEISERMDRCYAA
ncbi:MAG: sugar phosphate isomerase/epimerase [Saprospiraceae bacterium]|nr:sugar phosphate isomerase/epimerase [Saprospiraceae bacterium]